VSHNVSIDTLDQNRRA